MTLLMVERIKLFSTRSPWWCALVTLAVTIGFTAIFVGASDKHDVYVGTTEFNYGFGMAVVMVLAVLAVTTEYRFGTIRTTFQAVPRRGSVVLAKATVVALLALVLGELAGFGSWAVGSLMAPAANLTLHSAADWANVAGIGVVYVFAAVIGVAVGILVRHSAGALSLVLIYSLAVENLVQLIPTVGRKIHEWLPFNVSAKFVTGTGTTAGPNHHSGGPPLSDSPLSPGWALAYFVAFALVLLAVSIGVARKRDA